MKKYLITGSTGFIGGRLVEKLIIEKNANITSVVRKYDNAARIARFDTINMELSELYDEYNMDALIANSDCVIHLAYDPISQDNNLKAIDVICEKCIKYSKKLIHISTISVYEPLSDNVLNERSSSAPTGLVYADRKLEIENKVFQFIKKGLKAIILQPTIVYGPYCAPWTIRPAYQLMSGEVILPNKGEGICNPVYIDDVCDAIIISAINNKGIGERFLISGKDHITWEQFYRSFENILNVDALKFLDIDEIKKYNYNPIKLIKLILGQPKKAIAWEPLKSILLALKDKLPASTKLLIKNLYSSYSTIKPKPIYIPEKQMYLLYNAKSIVDISKAETLLGYKPKYSFVEGFLLTSKYIRWIYK